MGGDKDNKTEGIDTFFGNIASDGREAFESIEGPISGNEEALESLANAPTGMSTPPPNPQEDSDVGHQMTMCRQIAETDIKDVEGRPSIMPAAAEIKKIIFGNDHYTKRDRLGKGGMSDIYIIQDEAGNRKVVKFTQDGLLDNPQMTEKLKSEGRIVQACNNCDNIVTIFDHGEATVVMEDGTEGKRYSVIMELLEGMVLRNFMYRFHFNRKEGHSLAIPNTVQAAITREVAFGAGYMARRPVKFDVTESTFDGEDGYIHKHTKFKRTSGFIHRDIKPENIALTNRGRPVIIDFDGALGLDDPANGDPDYILGTPFYMSPQAFEGKRLTNTDDVFCLCATAQEMACGLTLNSLVNMADVHNLPIAMYAAQTNNFERKDIPNLVSEIAMHVDPDYAAIINEGLKYDQKSRIQADDLERELTTWLSERGIDDPRGHIETYMNYIRGLPVDQDQLNLMGGDLGNKFELQPDAKLVFNAGHNPLWYDKNEVDLTIPFDLTNK